MNHIPFPPPLPRHGCIDDRAHINLLRLSFIGSLIFCHCKFVIDNEVPVIISFFCCFFFKQCDDNGRKLIRIIYIRFNSRSHWQLLQIHLCAGMKNRKKNDHELLHNTNFNPKIPEFESEINNWKKKKSARPGFDPDDPEWIANDKKPLHG